MTEERTNNQNEATTSQRALALSIQRWNFYSLIMQIDGEFKSIKFAEENGLLPYSRLCPTHRTQMFLNSDGATGYFRCQHGTCWGNNKISRAKGTWFENTKLPIQQVLYLTYCFARRSPYDEVQREEFSSSGIDCLPEHGYIHRKVNHSDPENLFIAEDRTHTQRIESQLRVVKRCFYNSNYSHNFGHWIIEYQWRRNIQKNRQHPFDELLKAS